MVLSFVPNKTPLSCSYLSRGQEKILDKEGKAKKQAI
jgi:hypothetical protein